MRQVDGIKIREIKPEKPQHHLLGLHYSFKQFILIAIFIIFLGMINFFLINNVEYFQNEFNFIRQFYHGKYLVLLQNNTELRPSGGFIGTFALVETKFARIVDIKINTNIYKLDDKYDYILQVPAPEPLQTILKGKYWSMHDANWSPDFPTSAQQVAWFYNEEGGENIDGVISINATVIANILDIIGPIKLDKYPDEINNLNFFDVLHQNIEKDYFANQDNREINEPKTILADLLPVIKEKAVGKQFRGDVIKLIFNEIKEKQLQFYSSNSQIEKTVSLLGFSGKIEITKSATDYLSINNANIGGQKSSLNIVQNTNLRVFVDTGGNINNTISISRQHIGDGQWPDADNINYMRVLVPKGSILKQIQNDGEDIINKTDISEEKDKTVWGFWFNTPIGTKREVLINYDLPFTLTNINDYQLLWQKQSGVISEKIQVSVNDQEIYNSIIRSDLMIK